MQHTENMLIKSSQLQMRNIFYQMLVDSHGFLRRHEILCLMVYKLAKAGNLYLCSYGLFYIKYNDIL